MIYSDWVLDASVCSGDGPMYCFCPVDTDGSIVIGLNMLTDRCPGQLVGVIHADGDEAAAQWAEQRMELLERLARRATGSGESHGAA